MKQDYSIQFDLIVLQQALNICNRKVSFRTQIMIEDSIENQGYSGWTILETKLMNTIKYKFIKEKKFKTASVVRYFQTVWLN